MKIEQNNWVKFLPITKFVYNNTKITSTKYKSFNLNYRYHTCFSFKKNFNLYSKSKSVDKLAKKLKNLIIVK